MKICFTAIVGARNNFYFSGGLHRFFYSFLAILKPLLMRVCLKGRGRPNLNC